MLGLGSGFAVVLLIASVKLKVEVDPKIEQIHEALPNVDCGACGFAGCGQYAKAVSANPELLGNCAPGGQETAEIIAGILNLQISASGPAERPMKATRQYGDIIMGFQRVRRQTHWPMYRRANSDASASATAQVYADLMRLRRSKDWRLLTMRNALGAVRAHVPVHAT
jgi:hypothetical protein